MSDNLAEDVTDMVRLIVGLAEAMAIIGMAVSAQVAEVWGGKIALIATVTATLKKRRTRTKIKSPPNQTRKNDEGTNIKSPLKQKKDEGGKTSWEQFFKEQRRVQHLEES
jgi:hypothetical protein